MISKRLSDTDEALSHINLLDATISVNPGTNFSDLIEEIAAWDVIETRPWINWNMHFIKTMPLTKAALAFQMFLPGTISVTELKPVSQDKRNTSADNTLLQNLTAIRTVAVPIFMNGNYKRCECEAGLEKETNFALNEPSENLIQLERFYSRRNRYASDAKNKSHASLSHILGIFWWPTLQSQAKTP